MTSLSIRTATELIYRAVLFYRATPCKGRQGLAAARTLAGVQSFVAGAATDNNSFRTLCNFDVADQYRRVHFAIHHEPCFTGGLDHRFCEAGPHRRPCSAYWILCVESDFSAKK